MKFISSHFLFFSQIQKCNSSILYFRLNHAKLDSLKCKSHEIGTFSLPELDFRSLHTYYRVATSFNFNFLHCFSDCRLHNICLPLRLFRQDHRVHQTSRPPVRLSALHNAHRRTNAPRPGDNLISRFTIVIQDSLIVAFKNYISKFHNT